MELVDEFLVRLRDLDQAAFVVPTQTSEDDRRSLLAIQNVVRNVKSSYIYLEIGSHVGGTLLPYLLDPSCRHAFSVDKRPASQLDERGVMYDYEGNSTDRMIATLDPHVPKSAFVKLTTFEADMSEVDLSGVSVAVDFAFIDGEHTNVAVFSDFVNVIKFMSATSIVAFHDANLICDGLQNIEKFLTYQGIAFRSFFLPSSVFVILMGDFIGLAAQPMQRISVERDSFIHTSRISLWRTISEHVELIRGDAIGHSV